MKKRLFHLVIVDESGSMECIRQRALRGMNETLKSVQTAQRNNADQEHYVTLITFSSEHIHHIYDATPAAQARPLDASQYRPCGCTPLYDAIGQGIQSLSHAVAPDDSVLVTIITDGEENCSHEFTHQTIRSLIRQKQSADWVFVFIGANIDVEHTGGEMSVDYCVDWEQNEEGTGKMFDRLNRFRTMACCALACGSASLAEAARESDI